MKACITILMLLSLTACNINIEDPTEIIDKLNKCSSIGMKSKLTPLGNNTYSITCI